VTPFGLICAEPNFCFDPPIWIHDIGNGETGYFSHTHTCVKAKCQDQSVAHGVGALGYKFQQVFKFCWGQRFCLCHSVFAFQLINTHVQVCFLLRKSATSMWHKCGTEILNEINKLKKSIIFFGSDIYQL
jgi:hypothetical protein